MPLQKLKTVLLALSFPTLCLNAQKTAVFNGKTYLVYPQVLPCEDEYFYPPEFEYGGMSLSNVMLPPIIGAHKDGEYLIYTTNYTLTNKRKVNGEKVYDTVRQVYGTFTIKNNKKEGKAFIYQWKKQNKATMELPYKNDLLEGDLTIWGYMRYYYEGDYGYPFRSGRGRYYSGGSLGWIRVYDLHFKEGILADSVREYGYDGKTKVLISVLNIQNGMVNGIGRKYDFKPSGKKAIYTEYMEGHFVNGVMEGAWFYRKMDGTLFSTEHYSMGVLTREMYYAANGELSSGFIYGRDSVLKYFPNPAAYPRMPYTHNFHYIYYEEHEDFDYTPLPEERVVYYRKDGQLKSAFIIDNYASSNYYLEYDTFESTIRDTAFNGKIIRTKLTYVKKGGKRWATYLIDTCGISGINNAPLFCETLLASKYVNKHGKVVFEEKERSYYQNHFTDSFSSMRTGTFQRAYTTEEQFYYPAKDYMYSNYVATSGSIKGARIYHGISGHSYKTINIVRYIYLPSSYDTICLVDTLCRNGKFLYESDQYFNDEFGRYLKDDIDNYKNIFTEQIKYFSRIEPVKHTCVMLGRHPFTGQLTISYDFSDKLEKVKSEVYNTTIIDPFYADKEIGITICYSRSNLWQRDGLAIILPESRREFLVRDGMFDAKFYSYNIFGKYYYGTKYDKNRLSGNLSAYTYKVNIRHKRYRSHRYREAYYRNKSSKITEKRIRKDYEVNLRYLDGEKEGQLNCHQSNGSELLTFHHDQLHGAQYYISGDYIEFIMHFKNDTLEGRSYQMGANGYPLYMADFSKGELHGNLVFFGGGDTTGYVKEKFPFEHGYLIGDFLQYTDTGNLKLRIRFDRKDSIYFKELGRSRTSHNGERRHVKWVSSRSVQSEGRVFNQVHWARVYRRGYYTYYYPDGNLFKQGYKEWNEPTGNWTFYREGKNRIYKIIDFMDTVFNPNTPDSMHVYGLVKAFYDDGKLMFKGYALDKESKFSCEADGDMPMEENYYLEFYDTLGNNILKNGSGFVVEYQSTGHKYREGRLDSFRKEGFWIHYSKFGLPEEMGLYKNGKKNGRWLEGDLGELNLDEKVCFMSDEDFRAWVFMYGSDLTLTEVYYVDGREVSRNTVEVIKN